MRILGLFTIVSFISTNSNKFSRVTGVATVAHRCHLIINQLQQIYISPYFETESKALWWWLWTLKSKVGGISIAASVGCRQGRGRRWKFESRRVTVCNHSNIGFYHFIMVFGPIIQSYLPGGANVPNTWCPTPGSVPPFLHGSRSWLTHTQTSQTDHAMRSKVRFQGRS